MSSGEPVARNGDGDLSGADLFRSDVDAHLFERLKPLARPSSGADEVVRALGGHGRESVAVELVRMAGSEEMVVAKTLARPAPPALGQRVWLNEALFYAELRERLVVSGLRIPALRSLDLVDRGQVRLRLELLEGFEPIRSLPDRASAAHRFGRLAALGQTLRPDWLTASRPTGDSGADGLAALRRFVDGLPGLAAFFRRSAEIAERHRATPKTLCHGDASRGNLLVRDGQVAALDWARVCRGAVGDDLGRIVQPWLAMAGEHPTEVEKQVVEEGLFVRYLKGALEVDPSLDPALVRLAYEVRSVVLSLTFARALGKWVDRAPASGREQRQGAARDYYLGVDRRAAALAEGRLDGPWKIP